MPSFLTCFPSRRDDTQDRLLEISPGEVKRVDGCVFCDVRKDSGFAIVHEDDELIAFHDRSPQARVHLLIIPRAHIANSVRNITQAHLPLLRRMDDLAHTLAREHVKTGFHIPPFSSVPHLHLHVFVPPHTVLGRVKYPVTGTERRKGWGWFVTGQQAQGTLERGERITLGRV